MAENEQDGGGRDAHERVHQARRERSDAAWRPFEEKWSALVASKSDALREVTGNKFMTGTPAEADAEDDLNGLFPLMARAAAETAHEKDFESRWGFRVLEHVLGRDHLCVIFNNNPYKAMPTLRAKELEEYRDWLAEVGVDELAYAEYPERGEDEGCSYALLLWCVDGSQSYVEEKYRAVTLKSMAEIPGPRDGDAMKA